MGASLRAPTKQMSFLIISNENIFFKQKKALDSGNSCTLWKSRIGSGMEIIAYSNSYLSIYYPCIIGFDQASDF